MLSLSFYRPGINDKIFRITTIVTGFASRNAFTL